MPNRPRSSAGKIDALFLRVLLYVRKNIGQLKGDTAFLSQFQSLRILETKDVDDGEPHYARDVIAIVIKLFEGLDAPRFEGRSSRRLRSSGKKYSCEGFCSARQRL